MAATVKVAVRVRPMSKRELEMNSAVIINMESNITQIANIKLPSYTGNDTLGRERLKQFTYDYSYWSVDESSANYASQKRVFDDLGFDVVQSSYQGYNACVFAYGQTGSGKTHTMMGSQDDPGLTPRVCESLFSHMYVGDTTYRTEVSYLEIYNERVRDLLRDHNQPQLNLKVREHPKDGPYVQDLSRHLVLSYADIEELLNRGNANRTTAATNMNDHSSRSHAIFTILFTQAKFTEDAPSEVHSKIHLVDLAGSERADMAGTTGDRLKEGGSINKSLVTLGNVISSLADLSEKLSGAASRRSVFIPYRDSVLTWLLKDSLGGNAKTIMIATISPAECHYAETLSTLRYAKRAKKIINKPTINEDPNVKLIRELRAENARLRALLADSMRQGGLTPVEDFAETREKLTRNEEKVQELIESWAVKWQESASILHEHQMLALRKEGSGVVLDSVLPYLLCIDDDILSTGMKLYHLKEGDTTVGREDAAKMPDIVLVGRCIEADHCTIRYQSGEVTLLPVGSAMCCVDNVRISEPKKLSQGSVIRLGRSHLFRFNHPSEVAKMREELKENGKQSSIRVWKDIQWMSSNISMTDSAVGSDLGHGSASNTSLGEWMEYDRLEEKRKEVERLEEEHCLAEAKRLSLFASQEANREELKVKEEELRRLSTNAQEKIETLNASIQHQYYITQLEKGRLLEEQKSLQDLKSRLEHDKALARSERQRLRRQSEMEQARLDAEHSRQMAEWTELTTERQHQMALRENERESFNQQKEQIEKFHNIEKKIWKEEMSEMRNLVDAELQNMRYLAGLSLDNPDTSGSLGERGDFDDDDSLPLDIDSLKLVVPPDEDGPIIPELYLTQSPESLCNESRSYVRSPVDQDISSDVSSLIKNLVTQVYDVHERVCAALQLKYSSFRTTQRRVELDSEFASQLKDIRQLYESIVASVSNHDSEQESVKAGLEEFERISSAVDRLLRIDLLMTNMEKATSESKYLSVLDNLESVHSLLSSTDLDEEVEVKVQKVIQTELCIIRERLLYELGEAWNRLVRWTPVSEVRRQARRPRTVTLEFSRDDSQRQLFSTVVMAMLRANMLDSRVKMLGDNLMFYIVEGVVRDRSTLLQIIDEPDRCIVCAVISPSSVGQVRQVVPPSEAFLKLQQIFTCLHGVLSSVGVSQDETKGAVATEKDLFLVKKLGKFLVKKLFEYVYDECLSLALPQNGTQFEKYNELVAQTEQFQEFLTRLEFLSGEDPSLVDYLNNVNSLFANNKSQEILKRAHELMLQDLFHTAQISSDHPIGVIRGQEVPDMEKFVKDCKEKMGTANFKLPKCQISVSVYNLMLLAYETLKQALSGSQEGAFHLCNSIHSMFELYCDVVPSYHKEKIATLPLPAALYQNNCSFIAHHLLTIDKALCMKLTAPGASLPAAGREPKLAELVPKIRRLGNDGFTEHIQNKREELCRYLVDAEGFSCVADDEGAGAMRAVQNMLNQLKHIGAIWSDVLPTTVYCRSIGSLLSVALEEVVDSVTSIVEFSADDCQCLQRIFNYLIQSAADVFRLDEPGSNPEVTLHEFVSNWMKFKELTLALGFRLQEVCDRWSDGKGPLALHFTGEQMASLVVAMFEKTAKRDALVTQLHRKPSIHMT